jgi:hypothetical protein
MKILYPALMEEFCCYHLSWKTSHMREDYLPEISKRLLSALRSEILTREIRSPFLDTLSGLASLSIVEQLHIM